MTGNLSNSYPSDVSCVHRPVGTCDQLCGLASGQYRLMYLSIAESINHWLYQCKGNRLLISMR